MTLTSPGTAASPVRVICVNDGAEPPTALATTATVSTTGANYITTDGFAYVYGITFTGGNGASNGGIVLCGVANPAAWWLDGCKLVCGSTSGSSRIYIGITPAGTSEGQEVVLNNTVCQFGAAAQGILCRQAFFRWLNTANAVAGTSPTTLLFSQTGSGIGAYLRGVDLSAVSGNIALGSDDALLSYTLENCKLHASATFVSGSIASQGGVRFTAINCDSADTNYRFYRQTYQGTITSEPVIVKTGGSSDGTTPFSRKFVSTANSKIYSPLEGLWTTFWNETVGSAITVAADVVTDGVTLTDAEAWIEAEYLGNGSFPISTTTTDRVSDIIFGTPANQTTSSATWTTTGLASPTKQTLSVSITPQEKGPIRARVCLAKASTTMYVDQVVMSGTSGRQYMIGAEGIINEGAGGGGVANLLGGIIQ